jgi:hypothetical protein
MKASATKTSENAEKEINITQFQIIVIAIITIGIQVPATRGKCGESAVFELPGLCSTSK